MMGLTALSWLAAPSLAAGRTFPCRSGDGGGTPAAGGEWARWADAAEGAGWRWDVRCEDPGDEACAAWAAEAKKAGKKDRKKDKKKKKSDHKNGKQPVRDDGGDGDDPSGGGDDEDTGTQNGQMTYYWASEPDIGYGSGNLGACDNPLVAFESVAVPKARWDELKGREVEIEGVCERCVVDDMCAGPTCKDLDLYVGHDNEEGYDGIESVRFRVGRRVPGHPCV